MKEVAIISIIAIVGILILTGIEIWIYKDDYMFSKEHEEQTKERRRRIEKRNYNWRNSTRKSSEMGKAKLLPLWFGVSKWNDWKIWKSFGGLDKW